MPKAAKVLVISPHLDDAVLSLGPEISAWRRQGVDVTVLTIFSGQPTGALSPAALEDRARFDGQDPMPMRVAENAEAARLLGFEAVDADMPELIFRQRSDGRFRCESLADIYGPLEPDDDEWMESVTHAVARVSGDRVFAPLGIGNHVDHVIVHRACERFASVEWYQDMPYALRLGIPSIPRDVTAADVDNWLDGVAAYKTQVPILFENVHWRRELRQWLAGAPGG